MKNSKGKYYLLSFFLLLLWAPMVQQTFDVFTIPELQGAFVKPDNIILTSENWFSGDYGRKKEDFIRSDFGFHAVLVRLYNQIQYSFFNQACTKNVVIGKDDYIYEDRYIDAYYGRDFIGDEAIEVRTQQVKELQDTLKNYGIFLFTVFTPGKGMYYPEFIPENKRGPRTRTNYEAYIDAYNRNGLNYIDFEKYFIAMKDTSRYPLYTRGGIHWTYYGEVLAIDSIIRYLHKNAGMKRTALTVNSIKTSTVPEFRDNDAASAMNILKELNRDTLAYPQLSYNDSLKQFNFFTVGDSYYWDMQLHFAPFLFNDSWFWYYYNKMYGWNGTTIDIEYSKPRISDILIMKNVVCIFQTDAALTNLGWGFFWDANTKFKSYKWEHKNN